MNVVSFDKLNTSRPEQQTQNLLPTTLRLQVKTPDIHVTAVQRLSMSCSS